MIFQGCSKSKAGAELRVAKEPIIAPNLFVLIFLSSSIKVGLAGLSLKTIAKTKIKYNQDNKNEAVSKVNGAQRTLRKYKVHKEN